MGKKLKQKAAKFTPPRNKTAFRGASTPNTAGTNTPRPYFSLRDELSNTEKHRAEWTPQTRLRDQKISFVSAGSIEPLDEPKPEKPTKPESPAEVDMDLRGSEDAMAHMDINAQSSIAEASFDEVDKEEMDIEETTHIHAEITVPHQQSPPQQQHAQPPPPEEPPAFFIDTEGDQSLAFKGPKAAPAPRAPSPARSSSSEEVVLFRGRAGVTVRDDPPVTASKPASKPANKPASKAASNKAASNKSASMSASGSASRPAPQPTAQPAAPPDPRIQTFLKALDDPPEWAKMLHNPDKSRSSSAQPTHWPSVDEALGFDSGRLDEDLSGVRPSRKSKKNRKKQNRIFRLEQDLENELMDDYIANIDQEDMPHFVMEDDSDSTDEFFDELLNKEEKDPDDVEGEWYDESGSEEDEDADEDEDEDENEEDDEEDEDSSDLEERLEREEREAWEDDADLRERRAQAMTDEELARLFAKQQDLGFDGDDIMIYDDRFGDVGAARSGLAEYSVKTTPKRGKKKGRKSDQFPDASLMADVLEQDPYGGFDVMDFDRPSLRRRTKGRKSDGPLPEELADLSDDDLALGLQDQWAMDRSKKARKKAEREELRQLGLIGSGKKNKFKPDLNQRYSEGITMGQVRFELQEFLEQDDHTTKAFPPMLKNDRKILHEIANHFNLKSKSVGSGKNRAPVLIKTQRTLEWDEQHFTRVQTFVNRGYLKNSSKKPKSTLAGEIRKARKAGGGATGAASYRNGEVVGQHAAEIPQNNFGRKLMEKMGWSAGMSLGKEGSSGLLVPVAAVIKSGKAGLG